MGYANQRGFSLVELLVALAVAAIAGTAMMGFFVSNTRTYATQTQVVDMQGEARDGLDFFAREFRSAGYDPTQSGNFGVTQATASTLAFTLDSNGNGTLDGGESTTYTLDAANKRFTRNGQALAENIAGIGFAFAFDANGDNRLDTDAGGRVYWAVWDGGAGTNWFDLDANDDGFISVADDIDSSGTLNALDTGMSAKLEDVRAVRLWVLAQTANADQRYANNQNYVVGSRVISGAGDGLHRRLRIITVTGRNLNI